MRWAVIVFSLVMAGCGITTSKTEFSRGICLGVCEWMFVYEEIEHEEDEDGGSSDTSPGLCGR